MLIQLDCYVDEVGILGKNLVQNENIYLLRGNCPFRMLMFAIRIWNCSAPRYDTRCVDEDEEKKVVDVNPLEAIPAFSAYAMTYAGTGPPDH